MLFFLYFVLGPATITNEGGVIRHEYGLLEIQRINVSHKSEGVKIVTTFKNLSGKTIVELMYDIAFPGHFNESPGPIPRKVLVSLVVNGKLESGFFINRTHRYYHALASAAKDGTVKASLDITGITFKDGTQAKELTRVDQQKLFMDNPGLEQLKFETIPMVGSVGVEPPVFTKKVAPAWPKTANKTMNHGYIILEATFRKDGKIEDIKVLRPYGYDGYGFEKNSIEALKKWKYQPGKVHGKPADVRMNLKVDIHMQ